MLVAARARPVRKGGVVTSPNKTPGTSRAKDDPTIIRWLALRRGICQVGCRCAAPDFFKLMR